MSILEQGVDQAQNFEVQFESNPPGKQPAQASVDHPGDGLGFLENGASNRGSAGESPSERTLRAGPGFPSKQLRRSNLIDLNRFFEKNRAKSKSPKNGNLALPARAGRAAWKLGYF